MTEEQRERAFPIHIELGEKADDIEITPKGVKKGKKRVVYPTLYIANVDGLQNIPAEGCMLVDFKRRNLSVNENSNGETTASVELEIRTICLEEEEEDEDTDDMIDKMYKKAKKVVGDDNEDDDEHRL